MIFGGFDWSQYLAGATAPDPTTSAIHYSNLWTYTIRGQAKRISCCHLHPSEQVAKQCARIIISQMGRIRREQAPVDTQHVASVLARANNVIYVGVQREEL